MLLANKGLHLSQELAMNALELVDVEIEALEKLPLNLLQKE
jgi:hypothetical protein